MATAINTFGPSRPAYRLPPHAAVLLGLMPNGEPNYAVQAEGNDREPPALGMFPFGTFVQPFQQRAARLAEILAGGPGSKRASGGPLGDALPPLGPVVVPRAAAPGAAPGPGPGAGSGGSGSGVSPDPTSVAPKEKPSDAIRRAIRRARDELGQQLGGAGQVIGSAFADIIAAELPPDP